MASVLEKKKNIYTQNGEDGIIQYIFEKLSIDNGKFIEFGAWDGKFFSNTYNLFLQGWNGIYIEADTRKFMELVQNFSNYGDRVECVNAYVGYKETDNLDTLIENNSSMRDFDFVSIDVDGLDYFIFEKMNKYLPKVICIEVNAGHHPEYPFLIPESVASENIGQSIKVISDMGAKKGYFPLCYTGNLFLVKNEYKHLFVNDTKSLSDIYRDFLQFLGRDGILHLKKTFVDNGVYNGFSFVNSLLNEFCEDNY